MSNNSKYELTFLFDKKDSDLIEKIEAMLKSVKATEVRKEDWGVRRLAYPIKKLKEAHYVYFEAEMEPEMVVKLNKKIRLEERIIRELIVKN